MNHKPILVFDFETDSADPKTANPVQISAIAIDPRTLEKKTQTFNIFVRPPEIDDKDYVKNHADTIKWHCQTQKVSQEELLKKWGEGVEEKHAWDKFHEFIKLHHVRQSKQSMFTAPIAAGANIKRFDLVISDRLNEKYHHKYMFFRRDILDVQDLAFYWFENLDEAESPKSYSMDNLRDFLGISTKGAHDALKDCHDCADIAIRFLKLHRKVAKKVGFRDAFKV